MVARLATMSRNDRPHVNPLYFVLDGPRVQLGTVADTLAAKNVAANPAVQILFEVEGDPDDRRVMRMNGRATIRNEPDLLRRYRRQDSRKYFRSPRSWWLTLKHLRQLWLTRRYLFTEEPESGHCIIEVGPTAAEILVASPIPRGHTETTDSRALLDRGQRVGRRGDSSWSSSISLSQPVADRGWPGSRVLASRPTMT